MATVDRFEELRTWQAARSLRTRVHALAKLPAFHRDAALRDQIRRAVLSPVSNIAEGFERESAAEFRPFLSVAKGSAGEVRAQLYAAFDEGYISQGQWETATEECAALSRQLSAFMIYLSKARATRVSAARRPVSGS